MEQEAGQNRTTESTVGDWNKAFDPEYQTYREECGCEVMFRPTKVMVHPDLTVVPIPYPFTSLVQLCSAHEDTRTDESFNSLMERANTWRTQQPLPRTRSDLRHKIMSMTYGEKQEMSLTVVRMTREEAEMTIKSLAAQIASNDPNKERIHHTDGLGGVFTIAVVPQK